MSSYLFCIYFPEQNLFHAKLFACQGILAFKYFLICWSTHSNRIMTQGIIYSLVWSIFLFTISTQLVIASVILLELATILYMTTHVTLDEALDKALSRLDSFHKAIMDTFPLQYTSYTRRDYLAFLLENRLGESFDYFYYWVVFMLFQLSLYSV